MMFDIQGNCFCESSGSGFGKAKVLYCYGEVRTMVMMMMMMVMMMMMMVMVMTFLLRWWWSEAGAIKMTIKLYEDGGLDIQTNTFIVVIKPRITIPLTKSPLFRWCFSATFPAPRTRRRRRAPCSWRPSTSRSSRLWSSSFLCWLCKFLSFSLCWLCVWLWKLLSSFFLLAVWEWEGS